MRLGALPARWQLTVKTLPFVAAAAIARVIVNTLKNETIALNPLYTGLVAGTIFILGFLLAGVLADYKESEKLPGEMAASIEAIADECSIIYRKLEYMPARKCLDHTMVICHSLKSWFGGRETTVNVLDRIGPLKRLFAHHAAGR